MPDPASKKTLMRSLGEFFGHIVKGVTADTAAAAPAASSRTVVKQEVEEETRTTSTGKMILRRSTIEEIEIIQSEPPAADGPASRRG